MSTAPELPKELPGDEPDDVLFSSLYGVRLIELNRPKKLNSLNGSMARKILPRLKVSDSDLHSMIMPWLLSGGIGMGKIPAREHCHAFRCRHKSSLRRRRRRFSGFAERTRAGRTAKVDGFLRPRIPSGPHHRYLLKAIHLSDGWNHDGRRRGSQCSCPLPHCD